MMRIFDCCVYLAGIDYAEVQNQMLSKDVEVSEGAEERERDWKETSRCSQCPSNFESRFD